MPYAHTDDPHVHLADHPLVAHLQTELRNTDTPHGRFRELTERIGQLLAYEALRDAPQTQRTVETPLEPYQGSQLVGPITIVPILRAGMGPATGMAQLIPESQVGHVGMFRDEQSLTPVSYYVKLPANIADGPVLLVDPMLATGGSASAAVRVLKERGCNDLRFLCLVAAPEGIAKLRGDHPDVPIYTAAIDRQLNDKGYILPGLGDAGDRIFGTEA
ncbi:MAG: uracil phosphoribosyltransferase [Phycisphaerales bacterium JB063]